MSKIVMKNTYPYLQFPQSTGHENGVWKRRVSMLHFHSVWKRQVSTPLFYATRKYAYRRNLFLPQKIMIFVAGNATYKPLCGSVGQLVGPLFF